MIKVLVVDDHAVVRQGMRAFLGMHEDIEVLGEAADGSEALDVLHALAAAQSSPDVVLMDLHMPKLDGVSTIAQVAANHPGVAVLVLTSYSDAERVRSAVAAGARGYILKDASPEEIIAAVRAVHSGQMPVDPAVTSALAHSWDVHGRSVTALTRREREIAGLLARGLSNREIGVRLCISEKTVRTHVSNILAKLGFASRTQTALWAIEAGLQAAHPDGTRPR